MFGQDTSLLTEEFSKFADALHTISIPLLIVGFVISVVLALFGYKLFKVIATCLNAILGLGIGAAVGFIIIGIIQKVSAEAGGAIEFSNLFYIIPIACAIISCYKFIRASLENPFFVIETCLLIATFFKFAVDAAFKIAQENNGTLTLGGGMIFKCIVLPLILATIVAVIFSFMASAVVIIGSSYGGVWFAVSCLFGILNFNNIIVHIIATVVLGTGCVLFQIRNTIGKCSLKEFLFHGQQYKKVKNEHDSLLENLEKETTSQTTVNNEDTKGAEQENENVQDPM